MFGKMKNKYDEIINFLKEYQETQGCKGYVIGISGGKDSTLVARLLVDAIGKDKVIGVLMPNGIQADIADSVRVLDLLDIPCMVVQIENPYKTLIRSIENISLQKISKNGDRNVNEIDHFFKTDSLNQITEKAKSNIAPRIRMTVLYTIAQSIGYRVVGTGNKSERFVGWFTKWGDGACDINPIAHLTCTEVVALGDYLGLPEELIHKVPADGITGKSDEENLGFSYKHLDLFINSWEQGETIALPYDVIGKIGNLHKGSRHKFTPLTLTEY